MLIRISLPYYMDTKILKSFRSWGDWTILIKQNVYVNVGNWETTMYLCITFTLVRMTRRATGCFLIQFRSSNRQKKNHNMNWPNCRELSRMPFQWMWPNFKQKLHHFEFIWRVIIRFLLTYLFCKQHSVQRCD